MADQGGMPRTYDESALRFTLPDDHFRLCDLPTYHSLKHLSLKEMDFCWLESNRLLLVEVKDFSAANYQHLHTFLPSAQNHTTPSRFLDWVDKVTDAMLILQSIWLKSDCGRDFGAEVPDWVRQPMPLTFVIAICLPAALVQHQNVIRDKITIRLKGRMALGQDYRFAFMGYGELCRQFGARVQRLP